MERGRSWPGALRIATGVAVAAAVSAAAAFVVWVAGLDTSWAVATVLALGAVGGGLVTLRFEEEVSWEPPGRDPPRGIRLAVPILEESLAACDRLARPQVARRLRAQLIHERDDRMARATIVRRVRALLVAELRVRGVAGVAPAYQHDDALVALLGPDARTVLQPGDDNPVTSAGIARCLDAIERIAAEPLPSR